MLLSEPVVVVASPSVAGFSATLSGTAGAARSAESELGVGSGFFFLILNFGGAFAAAGYAIALASEGFSIGGDGTGAGASSFFSLGFGNLRDALNQPNNSFLL